ncbi:MAG: hypothetical protein RLZZ437_25 [Pseudomonadota bacterium]|jgi:hypothetical protein
MPQDEPLRITVTPSLPVNGLANSTGAFARLGLDPAGNIQWNGGDNFSYFGKDWLENDNAQFENFDDPELAAAVRAQEARKPPAAVWTTTPREMIRDGARPIYTSTTPDVALTPRGSAVPPIPYDTWARPTHPLQFPRSVRATGQDVMVLRSQEMLTFGAEQGVALGVVSGTIMGPVQPLDHSTTVRAEGSYVIRDGDAVWMNNRNNLGVARLEGSTVVNGPAPPAEEPGFWAGLWQGAKDINEEYKLMQRGVGALQVVGGGLEAVAGGLAVAAGVGASATGAGAVVGVPTAIGGGALAAKGADDVWAGLQTLWTGNVTDTYLDRAVAGAGQVLGASEGTIGVLQGVAGAVGNPANIAKEGGERLVREGAEEAAERTARETAEASAERTARVTGSCYSIAMAAIAVARASGVQYVGGPHNGVRAPGYESHHTPPRQTGGYTAGKGPAIQMDVTDHQATQTFDNKPGNQRQRTLANGSKAGFMAAILSDVADVRAIAAASGDPTKYDTAIGMMLAYATCLNGEGSGK